MRENKIQQVINRKQMEKGGACINYKWVFEIKQDGTFCARVVACGYSQKPGIDFQELYSLVINDVVFHILTVLQMIWGLTAAFLNADLEEKIYIECPEGIVHQEKDVALLLKSMYGLVQAARQFFLKFCKILKKIGYKHNRLEPCLFYK
jgi:Reverse transcriptase (RNA-dependent DNA polymerase)